MRRVFEHAGTLTPADAKGYLLHGFEVPGGIEALRIAFSYDRGGELPHSLVTLSLFDPHGFRGAGHRFAPRQTIDLGPRRATPGFVPGPIPPGSWTIEVDVHSVIAPPGGGSCGYALAIDALDTTEAAPTPEPAPPPLSAASPPATDTARGRRWLRGELHLHSDHSDGRWTTREMAAHARGRGLDFMFLTDHNTVSGIDELREALAGEIAVLPGCELTTFRGHALALGPRRWTDWRTGLRGRTIDDVAREVRARGGVLVVAHPDAPPDEICTGCRWTHPDFDPGLAHAVEVWGGLWDGAEESNQGCLDLWRRWLDAGHRLAATGATDAHRPEDWQGPVPLTYLYAEDASLASLLEALRAGRTYLSSGPRLEIRARVGESRSAGVGESVPASQATLIEAACAQAGPAELRVVMGGATRDSVAVEGEGRLECRPRAADRWCCAELWSPRGDVLLAVTSPIYLT